MKLRKFKIGFIIVLGLVILLATYLFVLYLSVIDTKNVNVEGFVFDKITNNPIQDAKIIIENYRYESDNGVSNYDEYLGTDKFVIYSDEKGFYKTKIDKSAYVVIEIHKKEYKTKMEKGEYSSKNMNFKTFLNKK